MNLSATDVLRLYLKFCDGPEIIDHLGENSVVDWYGRTIRGKNKIQTFAKYDMSQQYQHKFYKATRSGAIEVKPTHLATRKAFKEEIVKVPEKPERDFFCTPPRKSLSPSLPSVQRKSLFLTKVDDDDDDDLGLSVLHSEEQITPPQKKKQFMLKKIKSHQVDIVNKSIKKAEEVNSPQSPTVENSSSYSHLMYIEAKGVLARVNQIKYRGVTTSCTDVVSSPVLEKETTLKIGYRIRLHDHQIYFSLIIYERISRNTNLRRNLCLDFDNIKEQEQRDEVIQARFAETPRKRKIPLKRLFL